MNEQQASSVKETQNVSTLHLQFGWWCLLCFLTLGIVLEGMHGFKIGWYLDVGNETRRLMWRLAHAHGTLLSLINIAFGLTLQSTTGRRFRSVKVASSCLLSAALLLPLGFFLGGIVIYGGDPGLGILLVPVGGLLLLVSVLSVAWGLTRSPAGGPPEDAAPQDPTIKRKRRR